MFVANANCSNCLRMLEVNVDTSEGVPSRVGVECGNCGAINHFVLSWEPRVWIESRAGVDLPAVAHSNKGVEPTVSTLRGPVSRITDEDVEAINLI